MTRRSASRDDPFGLPVEWEKQSQQGETPEAGGRTAAEAKRSAERVAAGGRRIMPSEKRRRERRVGGRLPVELVQDLRRISQEWIGESRVSSYVLERMIWTVICLYRAGRLELVQEKVRITVRELVTPDNVGGEGGGAELPRPVSRPRTLKRAICPTLGLQTKAELRRISRDLGYTGGGDAIAAPVLELLLSAAVILYDQGLLSVTEEEAETTRHRLVWKPRKTEEIA